MKRFKVFFIFIVFAAAYQPFSVAYGQELASNKRVEAAINEFFSNYKERNQDLIGLPKMLSYSIDDGTKELTINANSAFAAQEFTRSSVKKIYKRLSKQLPKPYNKYSLTITTNGISIDELVPDMRYSDSDSPNMWGEIDYNGAPWVSNLSRPNDITHGLLGRHLALWASHGRYYDNDLGQWKWQRPNLFGTTEDLFTQTIVVPYLIPMLENASANVFTPRERDYQTNEIIVDNDNPQKPFFTLTEGKESWEKAPDRGLAYHQGYYSNGENPFNAGTAISSKTTSKASKASTAVYQPNFSTAGRYAVYVSYQTVKESISAAEYTIYHKGQPTIMHVNQQMGGSTWVYLGTFDFDEGCNPANCVVLSNYSEQRGVVTTDAVRFGGGMGNIQRDGYISGLPRCLEGARYSAQWSGAPSSVYDKKLGLDDYSDDINVRSLMTNWLGGGSVYMPTIEGKGVPIELSLAVHSDAGRTYNENVIGTLTICTTNFNNQRLNSGVSRLLSKDFADSLSNTITRDLRLKYHRWTQRAIYDRNYSETRLPEVPAAIVEILSHQNFSDMCYGHDPNFKFTLARSIYKTILRFVNHQHGKPCIVQPLAPSNFRAELMDNNKVKLSWVSTTDKAEPTAEPTSYNVYTAVENGGFDNGQSMQTTACTLDIEPGKLYNFRITAVNRGGESFPTQVLSVYQASENAKSILLVDSFDRLSSPAVVNTDTTQGFDLHEDIGVERQLTTGWSGQQIDFDRSHTISEGPGAWGYSGSEMEAKFFMGNDFQHVKTHATAIANIGKYNISSCSHEAIESGFVDLSNYDCTDIILGLQKDDRHSLVYYKSFTPTMQKRLTAYMSKNGRLLISGAYLGSDMQQADEQEFLAKTLKLSFANSVTDSLETVNGLGKQFDFYRSYNSVHYAAPTVDAFNPISPAFCAMQYGNGNCAAVAYDGADMKSVAIGFPLECIKEEQQRKLIMSGLLAFLLNGK